MLAHPNVMKKIYLLTFLFCAFFHTNAQVNGIFNVRNFGAKGKKEQKATVNLQNALDECAKIGGGTVYFPPGDYLSGPIMMHSNIEIRLEAGATLFASRDVNDYLIDVGYKADQQPTGSFKTTFLRGENLDNISITGLGVIDGQADQVWESLAEVDGFIKWETENARQAGIPMERAYQKDPKVRLVYLMFCKNVLIQGVTIKDSPDWNLHLGRCSEVRIDGVKIYSSMKMGVNSDGIDIDACKNVTVSGCIIETGDDAICLKTTLLDGSIEACENIIVENCICTSSSTALKLGTESHGDFKNILFSNCIIPDCNRGLSIVIRDGATVNNVKFSGIMMHCSRRPFFWWGNGDPIWLVVLKRNSDSRLGKISDVTFENITAVGEGTSKLEGFEGSPLENIQFKNVKIEMTPESLPDKRANHGFMAYKVNKLAMTDCKIVWNEDHPEPKWGSAFLFENIRDLRLDKLIGKQAPASKAPAILLSNVQEGIIERCKADSGTKTFIQVSGGNTRNLILNNNYLKNAEEQIKLSADVEDNQVSK